MAMATQLARTSALDGRWSQRRRPDLRRPALRLLSRASLAAGAPARGVVKWRGWQGRWGEKVGWGDEKAPKLQGPASVSSSPNWCPQAHFAVSKLPIDADEPGNPMSQ